MAKPIETIEKIVRDIEQQTHIKVVPRGKEDLPLERVAQEHPARYKNFVEFALFFKNPR